MNQALYDRLLQIARSGDVKNYGDIAPLVGLDMSLDSDRARIGDLLDEISTFEFQNGRPFLSSVVIRGDSNIPGRGYFELATRLGLYNGDDRVVFWAHELTRVHNYWKGR